MKDNIELIRSTECFDVCQRNGEGRDGVLTALIGFYGTKMRCGLADIIKNI